MSIRGVLAVSASLLLAVIMPIVMANNNDENTEQSQPLKVLILHPMYAASHVLTLRALAMALVDRGHQVTVVRWKDSHNYPMSTHKNINEIILSINNTDGSVPHMSKEERASFIMPQELMWGKGTDWTALPIDAFITVSVFCRTLLKNMPLRQRLRQEKFDVAVVDLIYNECSLALAYDLELPVVGYWAFTFSGGEPQYTTAFSPPSSVPVILSHYRDVMSFNQRVINHIHAVGSHIVMQELDEWVAGSGDAGTILFSMGFIFNPDVVPNSVLNNIMAAFSKLPQRVLMKYNSSYNAAPPNVKVVDWLPQQDVLGHPNTVLFFTHCGMHGVIESLHYGIPMVGMPVFADQKDVLVRLQERGVAKGVNKHNSASVIYSAILEVLTNSSYRQNAKRISKILRDPAKPPLQHSIWLIEHVASTLGARHLKFSARHLNFIQFFGVDVFIFLICVLLMVKFLIGNVLKVFGNVKSKKKVKMS